MKPIAPTVNEERDAQLAAQDVLLVSIIKYIDGLSLSEDREDSLSTFLERTATQFDERSSQMDPSDGGFAHIQLMLAKFREIVRSAGGH